jgi:uncharacterized protein with von Willebrand factor type A (vWA) domain
VPDSPAFSLLRGIDRASFAAAFVAKLRAAGVPVGLTGAQDLVSALEVSRPVAMGDLYWTARVAVVRRPEEIAAYDAVFTAVFAGAGVLVGHRARRGAHSDLNAPVPRAGRDGVDEGGLPWATLPAVVAEQDGVAGAGHAVPLRRPSALPATADRPFEQLDPAELALLGAWLRDAVVRWPTRRSRRLTPHHRGARIALRRTMAQARRTGGEPLHLVRVTPVRKPRRVVMLCDVSQSMQAQAAAYLHLMRAVALVADAEVFAFATSLTRLTSVLAHKEPVVAVAAATAAVDDRFGGTRIAANVRALLASRHGDAVRGAVVIVGSDGWDSDPPAELAMAMARLRRRAHRVLWMNPRAGAPGFTPQVAAMAAALPFCDALLPADTFRSLAAVLESLGSSTGSVRG